MKLSGKTAVITGGGSGIGLALAKALADEGCRVAIAGRDAAKLQAAAATYAGAQPLLSHPVDVADRGSVAALFAWAAEQLGPLDILVNAAGVNIPNRTIADMRPEQWDQVLAINATGAYNCIAAVLPAMRARRDGLIINISSTSGKRSAPLGGVAYNASKFAMAALGTAVAGEAAPDGVRVTNVFPGEVNTPILDHRPTKVSDAHRAAILQPEDLAPVLVAIAAMPPRAHVPEIIIKPIGQAYC